jgi:hypothetical protein
MTTLNQPQRGQTPLRGVEGWAWLAVVDSVPTHADGAAPLRTLRGEPAGVLAAWRRRAKPVRDASRVDARIVDPEGASARISLVLPPPGHRLAFDDIAVQQARRDLLLGEPFDAVTTLLLDDSHFAGSLLVARGDDVARLGDDPFARLFPARVLHVGAGVLGRVPWPAGPVIERYGSAQPWPVDRFV